MILKAYQEGWKKVWIDKKMWVLLYLLNFAFALLTAFPFSGFLSKTVGHTLANSKMLGGFDYEFVTDFMREYGGGMSVILNLSFGIIGLFFIFSIFWMGGILSVLKVNSPTFSFQKFWQGSTIYFWRLTRLTFYFFIMHALVLGIFVFLFISQGVNPLEVESEIPIINRFKIFVPIYLILATILFMIQDYAKVHIIHHDGKVITQPIKSAFRFVFKNFRKCFGLYLLNILTFFTFFGIYWLLSNSFKSDTTPTILLFFIIGQIFILSRIAVKLLNLGSAFSLYEECRN